MCGACAEEQLTRALGEAGAAKCPMLELLVARDWRELLPATAGCGGEADALVDAACAKMATTRQHLRTVLLTEDQRARAEAAKRPRKAAQAGAQAGAQALAKSVTFHPEVQDNEYRCRSSFGRTTR